MRKLLILLLLCSSAEASAQNATQALRIVTFGSSLTAVGGWQDKLQQGLAECVKRPVEIINRGKGSMGSPYGLEHAAEISADRPDIVLMEFSVNDAYLPYKISTSDSAAMTHAIMGRLKPARVILMTMNPSVGQLSEVRPNLPAYYDVYRQIAREGVEFIDNFATWGSRPNLAADIPDGIHPTPEAAQAVIVPNVLKHLCP